MYTERAETAAVSRGTSHITTEQRTVRGCLMYTERAVTAAVSRGTSHITTEQRSKHTTWLDIKTRYTKLQLLVENEMRQERSESAREQNNATSTTNSIASIIILKIIIMRYLQTVNSSH